MKSKLKKLEGTARELAIEMPKEAVERAYEEVLVEITKTATVPGFRPGKAPVDMIRKKYKKDADEEVRNRLIPEGYQKALEEHKVRPVSFPEIYNVNVDEAGVLKFFAKVDAHPEISLKKYKGIKVTSGKTEVDEKEVNETFERVRGMNAEFTVVDAPIKKGDFGICDVETFMDGEIIAKKRENMWIEANKDVSLLGMGEELCNLKKGDKKDIEATLPADYPDKKFAGKKAVFKIEVKEVREKKLPELNDELAKKMGKDTLAELREEMTKQLLERKKYNDTVAMKNQIMEELIKKHPFDLPQSMIKRQLKVLVEKAENELAEKGLSKDAIKQHEEKLKEQLLPEAENKVRLYFVFDSIAEAENINVTDEETDEWLKNLAGAYDQPFDKVKEYYEKNDMVGGLKEQIREDKALDFVLSQAEVKK